MSENTMNENTEVQDTPNAEQTDQLVSPYQAAKIVNVLLAEDGITDDMGAPKEINPQMLYGYVRSGRIPSTMKTVNGKDRKFVKLADLTEWYQNYSTGQIGRGGGVSTEALAEQVKAGLNK